MQRFSAAWFQHKVRSHPASLWLLSRRTLYLMAVHRDKWQPPARDLPFRIDSRDDLELFEETESWHDRRVFLANAQRSLDAGTHSITLVRDDRLAFVAWFKPGQAESTYGFVDQTVVFPPKCATNFSLYVHPAYRRQGIFLEGMRFRARYMFEETDTAVAIAAVEWPNPAAITGHLKAGYETIAVLETARFLGRARHLAAALQPGVTLRRNDPAGARWKLEIAERA